MSQYYDNSQWPAGGQNSWDQTPPARSGRCPNTSPCRPLGFRAPAVSNMLKLGASSAVPREEPAAFLYQLEEVDRAIDNLQKSGKMFGGMPGGPRREFPPRHRNAPRPRRNDLSYRPSTLGNAQGNAGNRTSTTNA
jgi:hypothetical protein